MTSDRTQAYGRVIKTLEDVGPAKLQPAEQDRIRDAADTLIFAAEPDEARAALEDVEALAEHLTGTGRWTPSAPSSSCTTSWPAGRSRPSPDGRTYPVPPSAPQRHPDRIGPRSTSVATVVIAVAVIRFMPA